MKTPGIITAGLALGAFACLGVASARGNQPTVSVIRGEAQAVQADGSWKQADSAPVGAWLKSAKQETTVRIPGMTVRMEPGAKVRVTQLNDQTASLDARGGRVFVKMDSGTECRLSSQSKTVVASQGEFVLDAADQQLYVFGGDAKLVNEQSPSGPAVNWMKEGGKRVALDGPDVRRRNQNRKRFTQGEENQGKRIGEDNPPTYSPSPAVTESPAYTPSATPTFTPTSTPPPSSPSPPPQGQGASAGGNAWEIIGPVLGAGAVGAGAFFLANQDDDDNNNNNNGFFFASP